jgi:hypothetical protein
MFSTSFPKNHRKQNRINKLIAALDEHTAACDALKAELGCVEADDLLEKLWDTISELVERMRAIEPATMAGASGQGANAAYWYWDGSDLEDEDPIAVEIIKGLVSAQLAA